jgi:excisionase family DNA binding protein
MDQHEQQRLLQLETLIEQSHRLQLELLGLMRSMMNIEPPVAMTASSEAHDISVATDLPDKPTFSVKETAQLLGVSRDVVYDGARNGQIPVLRLGRRLLMPRAPLARMLNGG